MQVVQPKQWQRAGRTFYVGGGGVLSISVIVIQPESQTTESPAVTTSSLPLSSSLSYTVLKGDLDRNVC